uniref:Microtubule-associated protein RP/EB family member 1 n=2 Tax=Panagrellus redivivus TaxID=6233 RepID=A0A7E4UMT3_PANRE
MAVNVYATSATTENLSRHEMLEWVNDCLQSQFSKIEELHTGAGYCLFMEALFPGVVPIKKVKWNPRNELEKLNNWKLFMTGLKDVQVDKVIHVEKMTKGKFQDNFEFLQWFKKFFDANYDGHEYSPIDIRHNEPLPVDPKAPGISSGSAVKKASTTSLNRSAAARPAPPSLANRRPLAPNPATSSVTRSSTNTTLASTPRNGGAGSRTHLHQPAGSNNNLHNAVTAKLEKELEAAKADITDLSDSVASLERERDFYFSKLRSIEVMCQDCQTSGEALDHNKVLEILYETEDGFAPPEDDLSESLAA